MHGWKPTTVPNNKISSVIVSAYDTIKCALLGKLYNLHGGIALG